MGTADRSKKSFEPPLMLIYSLLEEDQEAAWYFSAAFTVAALVQRFAQEYMKCSSFDHIFTYKNHIRIIFIAPVQLNVNTSV